jgi:hypothetical protein
MLLCTRPRGISHDHERLITAALALSEEEREQQRQERWAAARGTLRTLASQKPA